MNISFFAQSIQELRTKAGLTQKNIAEMLNVTPTAVSKWERGLSYPDITLFPKFAVLLDMDIETLLRGNFKYSAENWEGLINIDDLDFSALLDGRPLIHFLIAYFMLAGICNITIVCPDNKQKQAADSLKNLNNLGLMVSFVKNKEDIRNNPKNFVVLTEECLLYGVDLTRRFQHSLSEAEGVTICYSKAKYKSQSLFIKTGRDRKVLKLQTGEAYYKLPLLFITNQFVSSYIENDEETFIKNCFEQNILYGELFPRGMIIRSLVTTGQKEAASCFLRDLKEIQGEDIGDLEEIAKNRGLEKTGK